MVDLIRFVTAYWVQLLGVLGGLLVCAKAYTDVFKPMAEQVARKRQVWVKMEKAVEQLYPNGGGSIYDMVKAMSEDVRVIRGKQAGHVMLSASPAYECLPNGELITVNRKWCRITGLTPEQARGMGWMKAVHKADREKVKQAWDNLVNSKTEFEEEFRFVNPHNSMEVMVHGQATMLRDDKGMPISIVGTAEVIMMAKYEHA